MAVVLPKEWLNRLGAGEEVELVQQDDAILVVPVRHERSIEDEPEFAQFLAFVAKDALSHPEKLGDMAELLEGNEDLYDGVPIE